MSTAILTNTCTVCGAEESLDGLLLRMIDDDEVRRLIADVVTASLPLGGLVVRYLRLHKPPKQKLRMSAVAKVLAELVPDMRRGQIERGGRIWHVGHDSWKAAIQAVFDAHDKGTLSVPLPSNAYLYQVLMRMADAKEGQAEIPAETQLRAGPHIDTVQVRGQSMPMGQELQQVSGGRDPELVKRDADRVAAAPAPASVRNQLAALRGSAAAKSKPSSL